jgi:septation ring formation regulator EzrA
MQKAQAARKRKKLSKRKYRNIIEKNKKKLEEVDEEIQPFKESLRTTNDTFRRIVDKLEVLEAENISVRDSLRVLKSRYRRGRLPSKRSYLKLSDDLRQRRKKINRNLNKLIQQLRSYLL